MVTLEAEPAPIMAAIDTIQGCPGCSLRPDLTTSSMKWTPKMGNRRHVAEAQESFADRHGNTRDAVSVVCVR